jgi:hypothetical protein
MPQGDVCRCRTIAIVSDGCGGRKGLEVWEFAAHDEEKRAMVVVGSGYKLSRIGESDAMVLANIFMR